MPDAPLILWFRRDLRLADNPMLTWAVGTGRPLIPVFVFDPDEDLGAAPKWRMGLAVESFAERLEGVGSRLILRRGKPATVLADLARETGGEVHWTALHAFGDHGVDGATHPGHLLRDPEQVKNKTGGFYKVFTPFWNALRAMDAPEPLPSHRKLRAPDHWPESERLADWGMGDAMNRGAAVVADYVTVGELAALKRLCGFLDAGLEDYEAGRDRMDMRATSGLSENLTYGEIGPRTIWHAARDVPHGAPFMRELAWREFAHHLMYHTPHLATRHWREGWEDFPWRRDNADAEAWRRGMTGEPIVDAAMRELFVTGTMHNRARMIVASHLTKHLLTDWRVGQKWFEETLIDWDPASNALNWQWVAGSGPDASPYFRIFNPQTQAEKFDRKGEYRDRWLNSRAFFDAAPRSWDLTDAYPDRIIGLAEGRARALDAYSSIRS